MNKKEKAFLIHWAKQNERFFNPLDDNDAAEQVGYYYGYDARDNEVAELKEGLQYYADINLYRMTAGGAYFIQESIPGTRARKALEKSDE